MCTVQWRSCCPNYRAISDNSKYIYNAINIDCSLARKKRRRELSCNVKELYSSNNTGKLSKVTKKGHLA